MVEHQPPNPILTPEKNRGNFLSDWSWRRACAHVVEVAQPDRGSEANRSRHQNRGIRLANWNAGLQTVGRWTLRSTFELESEPNCSGAVLYRHEGQNGPAAWPHQEEPENTTGRP